MARDVDGKSNARSAVLRQLLTLAWEAAAQRAQSPAMSTDPDITRLLVAWQDGNRSALDALTPLVYEELRKVAERYMRNESKQKTLQATALVHEAYARLVTVEMSWNNRAHFLGFMARLMRQILVDRARARNSAKRGADFERVTLSDNLEISSDSDAVVLELDQALQELRRFDELKSRIIELRFFGGLTYDEAADALDISTATLDRELRLAKAWLRHRLQATIQN
jgi:RNA polymerase sigma-70 factor, ECF subfamily